MRQKRLAANDRQTDISKKFEKKTKHNKNHEGSYTNSWKHMNWEDKVKLRFKDYNNKSCTETSENFRTPWNTLGFVRQERANVEIQQITSAQNFPYA